MLAHNFDHGLLAPGYRNPIQGTAVMQAAESGHHEMVEWLFDEFGTEVFDPADQLSPQLWQRKDTPKWKAVVSGLQLLWGVLLSIADLATDVIALLSFRDQGDTVLFTVSAATLVIAWVVNWWVALGRDWSDLLRDRTKGCGEKMVVTAIFLVTFVFLLRFFGFFVAFCGGVAPCWRRLCSGSDC